LQEIVIRILGIVDVRVFGVSKTWVGGIIISISAVISLTK
jgi:hypothetical protein